MALKTNIFAVPRKPMKRSDPRETERRMIEKGFLPAVESIGGENNDAHKDDSHHENESATSQLQVDYKLATKNDEMELATGQLQVEDTLATGQLQIEDTSATGQLQVGYKKRKVSATHRLQVEDTSATGLATESATGQLQKTHFPDDPPSIASLAKNRLAVIHFLYEEARKERGFSTGIIQLEYAAKALNIKPLNFKQTVFRLCQSRHISRRGFNAGGSVYTLHPNVFAELADRVVGYRLATESATKSATVEPCSSSSVINTLTTPTTTEQDEKDLIPPEYRHIDYSMLADLGCHFGVAHLQQIAELKMVTFGALQYSIYNLEFAISTNWKPKGGLLTTYLNFFMSTMRTRFVFEIREYVQYREQMRLQHQQLLSDLDRKGELPVPNKKREALGVDFEALVKNPPKAPFEN
jgi:hypothetical protein